MFNNYQKEQNEILKNLLSPVFRLWKKNIEEQSEFLKESLKHQAGCNSVFALELFITPDCNQNCKYCYLQKNKNLIYPKEINDENVILTNLQILLEYCLKEDFHFQKIDLFSGEIWGFNFGNKIFDIILEYIKKGLKIESIVVPSNCSFCQSLERINIINLYIQQFEKLNTRLVFSISFDGPYLENINRPLNNKQIKNEEYFERVFNFSKQHLFGFHPMIDASSIEYQIENYKSWIYYLKKFYSNDIKDWYGIIMQLEVRSNEWTDEKIIQYLNWLNFVIDTDLKEFFNNDLDLFIDKITLGTNPYDNFYSNSYLPYIIPRSTPLLGCSLGSELVVRLGDLAIVPCHRTSYKKFIYGNFIVEDNQIVDIKANNVFLANAIFQTGFLTKPKCSTCLNKNTCLKSCLGMNYESEGDIFYPSEQNCIFQKAKNIFIFEKYKKLGIFEKRPDLLNRIEYKFIPQLEEEEEKWKIIITQMIQDY